MRGVYCRFSVKRSDEHHTLSQYFRNALQTTEGMMVILFPRSDFMGWAQDFVHETLGSPCYRTSGVWTYNDKRIVFVHGKRADVDCEVGRIRGLTIDTPVLVCDGALTDDWLGVVR